ncbi:NAD(P)H-hydrate epimerase [Microbacterium sp. QXD-8]|uniref:NAD(P)H-hydrate epimerase n=1 Tax=Microbacterium psychrotolerans TaxID=3068321 RepID=A0ABU0Z2N1_9MICO|nr:NAD(P)H-hydrate epimerase [Microbacterium sp. QXD-8]MDQ7878084.1 NAD(P)H-hydrate epimerase [Microbacterium sp. QXD-8]
MSHRVSTYTAEQVRAAERPLLDAGAPLMRRAAAALADIVRAELTSSQTATTVTGALEPMTLDHLDTPRPRVLVLAGSGDNGGDALYAAAQVAAGADVDALLVADRFHEGALVTAVGAGVRRVDLAEVGDTAHRYGLIIDGILGIGASRDPALRGTAREAVPALLSAISSDGSRPRIVAVDIPSGLHPDTGVADDAVLPASVTVTFGAVKQGLVAGRGPELTGELVLVDIGLGAALESVEPAGEATVSRVVAAQGD